jgi:hypothetical protein
MRTYPKPDISCAIKGSQCAVIESQSNGPQPRLDLLKAQGWMPRIEISEDKVFSGELLNSPRQPLVVFPKASAGAAIHGSGRVFPRRDSSIASSINLSSLPAAASSSICLSQSSAWCSSSHSAIRRTSAGFSFSISASISSTLRMTQAYIKFAAASSCGLKRVN